MYVNVIWLYNITVRPDKIGPSHKCHDASNRCPIMHHFITEMCTRVHMCHKMAYCGTYAWWHLCSRFISIVPSGVLQRIWVSNPSKITTHYDDVIMSAIASQITSLTIVYSTVYSDTVQRKHQSSASLAFAGISSGTGEFPAQMDSNAENVSIWWHHHEKTC